MVRASGQSKSRPVKAAGGVMWSEEKSKIARRCGEKHILKWKCTKHCSVGTLFEVLMSKNCTPLWREAHFEVKMYKTPQLRSNFWSSDVEKLHAAVAKSTLQNVKKLCGNTFGSSDVEKLHAWSAFSIEILKKLRVREHFLHPAVARSAFSIENFKKNWGSGSTFWRSDVEKLHAAVARSVFSSRNVKKNWGSRSTFCRSIVEKLHAAVVRSSSCTWRWTKRVSSGRFFEVQMSKD